MKELIKTIVLVLLVVVAIYFAFVVSKVNNRMDQLNVADSVHVINIDGFDHNLHDLDLRFIGRGKHIQQFQRDLKALDQKLDITARKFDAKIDSVGLLISELRMNTEAELANLTRDQKKADERFSQFKRQTDRTLIDHYKDIKSLLREKNDLEKRVKILETPPEDPKKKK